MFFYNLAYTDEANITASSGYSEVHIIELKRPLAFHNDPIEQISNYIYDLQNSNIQHLAQSEGVYKETEKKVKVEASAMFYGYVMFDLNEIRETDKWKRIVKRYHLKPFMNGFMSNDGNVVIFVNSFESILDIAKKRNEIFINKILSQSNFPQN